MSLLRAFILCHFRAGGPRLNQSLKKKDKKYINTCYHFSVLYQRTRHSYHRRCQQPGHVGRRESDQNDQRERSVRLSTQFGANVGRKIQLLLFQHRSPVGVLKNLKNKKNHYLNVATSYELTNFPKLDRTRIIIILFIYIRN